MLCCTQRAGLSMDWDTSKTSGTELVWARLSISQDHFNSAVVSSPVQVSGSIYESVLNSDLEDAITHKTPIQDLHGLLCLGHQCSLNAQLPGLVTRKGEVTPQAQRLLSSHSNRAVLWGYCYMSKAGGQIWVLVDCFYINIKRNRTWQDRWIVNLCVCVCDILVPCTQVVWLCQ